MGAGDTAVFLVTVGYGMRLSYTVPYRRPANTVHRFSRVFLQVIPIDP